MKRVGFKMVLKPGFADEYQRRHQNLWPELAELLTQAGISDYVIYLDEATHVLYASHKVDEHGDPSTLAQHPVMRTWWGYMADIMETKEDLSPVVTSLREMFYLG